jgi:tetratricopeptide (TPR) repeat protein
VPGILGGSNDRAERYYKRALDVDPGEPLNYLFYARFLKSERGNRRGALELALQGLKVPPPGDERVESVDALRSLDSLVTELGKVSTERPSRRRWGAKGRRR